MIQKRQSAGRRRGRFSRFFAGERAQDRRKQRLELERLEARQLLAGVLISELMAVNDSTLRDEDGEYSDWLELHNPTDQPEDLSGMYLTDDAAELNKWQFPAGVSLGAGEYMVVFASNNDRRDPNSELHTNFRLSSNGDYLALVEADGTIAHEYDPQFPEQYPDISYGLQQAAVTSQFVQAGDNVQVLVPSSAGEDLPAGTWTDPGFDASGWDSLNSGVGFDSNGDFADLIDANGDLSSMQNSSSSAYIRSTFNIAGAVPALDELAMDINYDDGFVAYLNGTEVARRNAPNSLAWDSTATQEHGGELDRVSYAGFLDGDTRADFQLNGNAQWSSDRLRVTASVGSQAGSAFTRNEVMFGQEFTFSASLAIDVHTPGGGADGDGTGADGLAFVMQNLSANAIGGAGGALGLDGISDFVAVEFDTWESGSYDPDATMPTHIGIDTSAAGFVARTAVPRFNGGAQGTNIRYVWVDYDGQTDQMDVYFATTNSKPSTPTVSATVDLAQLFGDTSGLYVGFTAGTGGALNAHDVLNFNVVTGAGQLGLVSEHIDLTPHTGLLQSGTNTLAIHGLNLTAADDDFLVAATMQGISLQQIQVDFPKYFSSPSPGQFNGEGTEAPAGLVEYSHPSGIISSAISVSITSPSPTATIRYTTNGAIPNESSTLYTGPINVSGSARIRARAFETGRVAGPIVSENYVFIDSTLTNFQGSNQAFNSNLPIMVFDSYGNGAVNSNASQLIPVAGVFIPVDPDTGRASITGEAEFAGRGGMRIRGQTSQGFAKKQYALELWEEGVNDTSPISASLSPDLDVSIFGLPEESDWVIAGPYSDTTQLNNYMTFLMSNKIGLYAPRTVQVEVFVNANGGAVHYDVSNLNNSDYVGTYVLTEKIKVGNNRVDINQLSPADDSEPEITGGYIWKKDKVGTAAQDAAWNTSQGQGLKLHDPDGLQITQTQHNWLKAHINEFESVLYGPNFNDPEEGYAKYIDVDSWIDTWLLVEYTKNIDGFRLSTYYYKDVDGKIVQGPAWDYNLAFGNADYNEGGLVNTWYHSLLGNDTYPYWRRLFEDPNFVQKLIDRWQELRSDEWSTESLFADTDEAVNNFTDGNPNPSPFTHNDPISRNFTRWASSGGAVGTYTWPNCYSRSGVSNSGQCSTAAPRLFASTYNDFITNFKWFIEQRGAWMDSQYVTAPNITVDGDEVTITSGGIGDIYYTLDGEDPRAPELPPEIISQVNLVNEGDDVRAIIPTDGSLGTSWTALAFDDSGWLAGETGVGYDRNPDYLPHIALDVNAQMNNINPTAYIRVPFNVTQDPSSFNFMSLYMKYDDAFVAYLNGTEIERANAPATLAWNSEAPGIHDDSAAVTYVEFDVSGFTNLLQPGQNMLAIHGINDGLTSSDFLISPRLVAGESTQGGGNDIGSPTSVLYTGPFTVSENTQITARRYNDSHVIQETTYWSGPVEATAVITPLDSLAITELNFNPLEPTEAELTALGVTPGDVSGTDFEFVELKNTGGEAFNLVNVRFSDGIEFEFPSMTLSPGEHVLVVENVAAFEARYGAGHNVAGQYRGNLNNAGETIGLSDPLQNVLKNVTYSDNFARRADGHGSSLEVVDVAGNYDDATNWRASVEYQGSPGADGTGVHSGIVINEVLSHTDPPQVDSIELYNPNGADINIGGWFLSDSESNLAKFEIPAGTMILGGGYIVFDESNFNPTPMNPGPNDFALNGAHGDDVWLMEGDDGLVTRFADNVEFGAQANGESWGRTPDGTGVLYPMQALTLNAANSDPRIGPVLISEVHYNPLGAGISDNDFEFVEIHNPTGGIVDLTNWRIRGGVDYDFDANEMLGPSETLVILPFEPGNPLNNARVDAFRDRFGIDDSVRLVGGYSSVLANDNESVRLERPDEPPLDEPDFTPHLLEDQIVYSHEGTWPTAADGRGASLGRRLDPAFGLESTSWYAGTPTPGSVLTTTQATFVEINTGIEDPADLPSGSQPTSWARQRSDLGSIVLHFNQGMQLDETDLTLTNLGVNAPVDPDTNVPLTATHVTVADNVVTLRFGQQELGQGVYRLQVDGGVTDVNGNQLDGNGDGVPGDAYVLSGNEDNNFYRLAADWNGDEGVTIFDFPAFSYWFGQSTAVAPAYMDLDGDGGVTIFDFPKFAENFGKPVTFPAALASSALIVEDSKDSAVPADEQDVMDEQAADRVFGQIWNGSERVTPQRTNNASGEGREVDDEVLEDLVGDIAAIWQRS